MATFRIIVRNGEAPAQTREIECDSIEEARNHAVLATGECLKIIDGSFWEDGHWQLDIADDRGLLLSSILVHGVTSAALYGRE